MARVQERRRISWDNLRSIAGGSALKFGIYRRSVDGAWITGSSQAQRKVSTGEAIAIARKHRDQLIYGCEALDRLPPEPSDAAYKDLDKQMSKVAPDVSDTAWGHKYFSLLYPKKLDYFHVAHYQRYYLIKLLQLPAEGGRYACAGHYVRIAEHLQLSLKHLATVVRDLFGLPHRYWRIDITPGSDIGNNWYEMRDGAYVAVGWPELGDLSQIVNGSQVKEWLRERVAQVYSVVQSQADNQYSRYLVSSLPLPNET